MIGRGESIHTLLPCFEKFSLSQNLSEQGSHNWCQKETPQSSAYIISCTIDCLLIAELSIYFMLMDTSYLQESSAVFVKYL